MGNTRDFKSLGIWAEDAVVPVPAFPTPGVAYRNDALTENENKAGEPFDTKPDSASFNEKMYIITSFIDMMDKHGTIGWSDLVDYTVPAVVWASDSKFYFALQASGPSTLPRDPISEPTYWEIVTSATKLRQDLANETPGEEGSRLIGYNKFDVNGGVDEGLTVKAALDEVYNTTTGLGNIKLVMAGHFDGVTGLAIGNTFNVYQNKAFLILPGDDPFWPTSTLFRVLADDPNTIDLAAKSLVFVSVRAGQDPDLPPGNLMPSVLSVNPEVLATPPIPPIGGNPDYRPGIDIAEYSINTGVNETLSLDFDVLVVTIDPIGPSTFQP